MEQVRSILNILEANWVTILLLIAGFIAFLLAVADFRVRWAATTPEKSDDVEAKLFRTRVKIFVQFLKDLFKIKKDKSDDSKP